MALQMAVFKASGRNQAAVPHVADPPPLRADRLARDDGDHPLLADRRGVRGGGARHLHRRLHPGRQLDDDGCSCTASPSPARRPSGRCSSAAYDVVVGRRPRDARAARARPPSSGVDLRGRARRRRAGAAARRRATCVVPAPGVPETHRLFAGRGRRWAPRGQRARAGLRVGAGTTRAVPRPMLAVTGTDGKTTTTLLDGGDAGGRPGLRTVAAGNTDVPLVAALDLDLDVFVVECTSFRLAWTSAFRAEAAAWLNLAPDHLNWHRRPGLLHRRQGHIFANQRADDVAIGFVDDPVVMRTCAAAPGATSRSARAAPTTTCRPRGRRAHRAERPDRRGAGDGASLPHDLTNGLAAAALVWRPGSSAPTPWPRRSPRSSGRRTASSWSARRGACPGTTTPRPPPRTPPPWPSAPSTTSC